MKFRSGWEYQILKPNIGNYLGRNIYSGCSTRQVELFYFCYSRCKVQDRRVYQLKCEILLLFQVARCRMEEYTSRRGDIVTILGCKVQDGRVYQQKGRYCYYSRCKVQDRRVYQLKCEILLLFQVVRCRIEEYTSRKVRYCYYYWF